MKKYVSIPLEQGSVLRQKWERAIFVIIVGLNPFGTGQCLTTDRVYQLYKKTESQSLWNRAVSYDEEKSQILKDLQVSIPLEQGSVLRH